MLLLPAPPTSVPRKKAEKAPSDRPLFFVQGRMTDECATCGKKAGEAGRKVLLRCEACTISPQYCSSACQRASWKGHKEECKANPVKKEASGEGELEAGMDSLDVD